VAAGHPLSTVSSPASATGSAPQRSWVMPAPVSTSASRSWTSRHEAWSPRRCTPTCRTASYRPDLGPLAVRM